MKISLTSTAVSLLLVVACAALPALAGPPDAQAPRQYHVSALTGNDANDGSAAKMLKTISAAALRAQPGDTITVHEGVYRERIDPPRGGQSDASRITYQAAPGEKVEIKGSEIVKHWTKVRNDTWRVTLPNSFFGGFNPYSDLIRGDWFVAKGRQHHTGAVYLHGDWLWEAARLDEVLRPARQHALWFGRVDGKDTTIWAQFKGLNPNEQVVEINVRKTVFYPHKAGINYLTVRGFTMRQAATNWAPPTAEQVGLIGTNWSRGWIIENNTISHSRCCGIALGKHGDKFDNTSADTAEGYVATIHRALQNGWTRENIGHHVVRNNHVSHCEQTGIVGSMGCAFSTVTGNTIHDIHVQRLFSGYEMAGIKFHGAVDVVISGNHVYRTCLGIWLDWMAQGARVTGNLLHDNPMDLFLEVDHGPLLVDNNIFLSPRILFNSQGIAVAHNLIAGSVDRIPFDARMTPLHKPHATELAGLHDNPCGDIRFYNNLLLGGGNLTSYNKPRLPVKMAGNVFLKGATPSVQEKAPLLKPGFDPGLKLVKEKDGFYLELAVDEAWSGRQKRQLVTSELLGKAVISDLPFENADGSPAKIDTDYFGKKRDTANPFPGPFEIPAGGKLRLKVFAE